MPNSHASAMETSERQTNFLKRGEQLAFSNILPTDTEDSRQDDGVHESSDHEMNPIEREAFQKHVQSNQSVDDGQIFLTGEDYDNSMSEDETTNDSSPTSAMREYLRRGACPSMPTMNHSDSTPPEDSEGGLVKRMLRRSLAWSQDSGDTETKSWKRRKDNPSSEFATALCHLPALSPDRDTSPTCVNWEDKLTDLYGLTSAAQESDED